jgi:hypothetical protein
MTENIVIKNKPIFPKITISREDGDTLRFETYIRKLNTDGNYYLCYAMKRIYAMPGNFIPAQGILNFIAEIYIYQTIGFIVTGELHDSTGNPVNLSELDENQESESERLQKIMLSQIPHEHSKMQYPATTDESFKKE